MSPLAVHILNISPERRTGAAKADRRTRIVFIILAVVLCIMAALGVIFHLGMPKP